MKIIIALTPAILVIGFCFLITIFFKYKDKYPCNGINFVKQMNKETNSFYHAIQMLEEGKRIRRRNLRYGFTKVKLLENNKTQVKYYTYWIPSEEKELCEIYRFSLEDVLANDWIIDE